MKKILIVAINLMLLGINIAHAQRPPAKGENLLTKEQQEKVTEINHEIETQKSMTAQESISNDSAAKALGQASPMKTIPLAWGGDFSPDGHELAVEVMETVKGNRELKGVKVLNLDSGQQVAFFAESGDQTFSYDGKLIAISQASSKGCRTNIYEVATGSLRLGLPDVCEVAFSRDGAKVVAAFFTPGLGGLKVIDLTSSEEKFSHSERGEYFRHPGFSKDGTEIFVVADGRILVIDLQTKKKLREWKRPGGLEVSPILSGDGVYAAFETNQFPKLYAVKVVNLETGETVLSKTGVSPPTAMAFSGDSKWLTKTNGGDLEIFDLIQKRRVKTIKSPNRNDSSQQISMSSDGAFVAESFLGIVYVIDVKSGAATAINTSNRFPIHFSPKGRVLLIQGYDALYLVPF